jgi:hypothetical protein
MNLHAIGIDLGKTVFHLVGLSQTGSILGSRTRSTAHVFRLVCRIERRLLALGDYSIAGLEDECVVERKDLADLVRSINNRPCRVSIPAQADGGVSSSTASDHGSAESGQIEVFVFSG